MTQPIQPFDFAHTSGQIRSDSVEIRISVPRRKMSPFITSLVRMC